MTTTTDFRGRTLTAPWIWLNGRFRQHIQLCIDASGKIAQVIERDTVAGTVDDDREDKLDEDATATTTVHRLNNMALLPGFVNAHSHAFHRCLRGRSQIGGKGADNFWKWRQQMYAIVDKIDYNQMKEICVDTFREMLSAGITTVGEFHYVHHASDQPEGTFSLDLAVVDAALELGIRLVLIVTLYMRSGFSSVELEPEQWRFGAKSVPEFCAAVDEMREKIAPKNPGTVTMALAVHSLRAVAPSDARQLVKFALQRRMALHIHLEEQPEMNFNFEFWAELEQCKATDGRGREPSEVLLEDILPPPPHSLHFLTVIHCTHSARTSLHALAARGAHLCVCPCTEGFLGDGVPFLNEEDRLCVGTDCNNRIAIFEELRWLAFCQNMRENCRNWACLCATKLLQIGTKNGAESLGLGGVVGEFRKGQWMDFVAIDCKSPRLAHFIDNVNNAEGEQLADAIVFGTGNSEVALTTVGGQIRHAKTNNKWNFGMNK